MREILFRGKTESGDWAYGYYVFTPKRTGTFGQTISQADFDRHYILTMKYNFAKEINPETVGQYTGLTDKNGTKIFEGDIVKCTDKFSEYEFIAVVMFGNPNGTYNWGFQLKRISGATANTDILLWVEMEETGAFIEVIGNIHDNPELMKGGEG